jgi:hypothetical protein
MWDREFTALSVLATLLKLNSPRELELELSLCKQGSIAMQRLLWGRAALGSPS